MKSSEGKQEEKRISEASKSIEMRAKNHEPLKFKTEDIKMGSNC